MSDVAYILPHGMRLCLGEYSTGTPLAETLSHTTRLRALPRCTACGGPSRMMWEGCTQPADGGSHSRSRVWYRDGGHWGIKNAIVTNPHLFMHMHKECTATVLYRVWCKSLCKGYLL